MNSLENKDILEKFLNDPDYERYYNYFCNKIPRFNDLPDTEKRIALALFLNKESEKINFINEYLYCRKVPTIQEFLDTDKYIGMLGRQIYPYWRKEMIKIFDPNNNYFESIFGGAIGIGKTTVARLCVLYNLIRICCLRNPQETMGVTPDTLLGIQLMSLTLSKADITLIKPFETLLHLSPFFQEVRKPMDFKKFTSSDPVPYCKEGEYIRFPNNILLMGGSRIGHTLGVSLVSALLDEAEFRISGITETFEVYSSLKDRIRSRFLGARFTFLALISSAKLKTGIIYNYTKNIKKDDPYCNVMRAPIWEIKNFSSYNKGHFYVLNGSLSHPSRFLDIERNEIENGTFIPPPNTEIIKVPSVYRSDFERNLEKNLQDLAGVQTSRYDNAFDDLSYIEDLNLIAEFNLVANLGDKMPLVNKLPRELFMMTPDGMRLKRYPKAPRYIHADAASTSEYGFSIIHKELNVDKIVYVVDFVCYITSEIRIDLNAVKDMIVDLSEKYGVHFAAISFDQFQCFTGDTKISLLNGEEVEIKELVNRYQNEELHTYTIDLEKRKIVKGKILKAWCNGKKNIMRVYLNNNEIIKCTKDHRFMLKNGEYKQAQYLKKNEDLMSLYKTKVYFESSSENIIYDTIDKNINHKVLKIEFTDEYEDVYDISIDNFPNFALSSGVFVHNSEATRQELKMRNVADEIKYVSVDRTAIPYYGLSLVVAEGALKVGSCSKLKHQLSQISLEENKVVTPGRKDMADSVCLSSNTKITLSDGSYKTIKELYDNSEINFTVLSYDIVKKRFIKGTVRRIINNGHRKTLLKITLDNDCEILCTHNHLLLAHNGKYREASNISPGNILLGSNRYNKIDKIYYKVENIEEVLYEDDVYDLVMDNYHNFRIYAGVYVHNCGGVENARQNSKDIPEFRYDLYNNSDTSIADFIKDSNIEELD